MASQAIEIAQSGTQTTDPLAGSWEVSGPPQPESSPFTIALALAKSISPG